MKAKTDALRESYRQFRKSCGWTAADIAEMDSVISKDVAAGSGADRDLDFPHDERMECWQNWLDGKNAEVMGDGPASPARRPAP